jgi:hypothetical protein
VLCPRLMATDSSNGLHIKGGLGTEFSASQDTVASFERMWNSTLEWAHSNPFLFVFSLIFLLIALFIIGKAWNDRAKMKLEYDDARKNAKTQMRLPLNGQGDT